jgi:serine/threonine-protein phosphatase PP1 catalytic subunit
MGEADRRERSRRVRRKPGLDQLSSQGDGTSTPLQRKIGHVRSQTWSDSMNAASDNDAKASLRQNIQQLDLESSKGRSRQLKEQRALWEATLPMPSSICVGRFLPEHT